MSEFAWPAVALVTVVLAFIGVVRLTTSSDGLKRTFASLTSLRERVLANEEALKAYADAKLLQRCEELEERCKKLELIQAQMAMGARSASLPLGLAVR